MLFFACDPVQQHGAVLRAQAEADGTEVQRQGADRHRWHGGERLSHVPPALSALLFSWKCSVIGGVKIVPAFVDLRCRRM